MPCVDRRAVPRRHVVGRDDVLHADGNAVERTARCFRVAPRRFGERLLGIEIFPGADRRLARLDAFEAAPDQILRVEAPRGDLRRGGECPQFARPGHRPLRTGGEPRRICARRREPAAMLVRQQSGLGSDTASSAGGRRPTYYRSEEHTSELQSLMRISYAVFCLKKNNQAQTQHDTLNITNHTMKEKYYNKTSRNKA